MLKFEYYDDKEPELVEHLVTVIRGHNAAIIEYNYVPSPPVMKAKKMFQEAMSALNDYHHEKYTCQYPQPRVRE